MRRVLSPLVFPFTQGVGCQQCGQRGAFHTITPHQAEGSRAAARLSTLGQSATYLPHVGFFFSSVRLCLPKSYGSLSLDRLLEFPCRHVIVPPAPTPDRPPRAGVWTAHPRMNPIRVAAPPLCVSSGQFGCMLPLHHPHGAPGVSLLYSLVALSALLLLGLSLPFYVMRYRATPQNTHTTARLSETFQHAGLTFCAIVFYSLHVHFHSAISISLSIPPTPLTTHLRFPRLSRSHA
jgi:hypothetical protein